MKVKDFIKALKDRGIDENADIRIIVNNHNPEDADFDTFYSHLEIWGWEDDSTVDLFITNNLIKA
jgi:hypothetical protein